MTTATKCRANDPATCTDPNCPEKRAGQAAFFGTDITSLARTSVAAKKIASPRISHEALSELMEFGVTVSSNGAGGVRDASSAPYVEEIQYVDLDADGQAGEPEAPAGWEYLKGFTGQYGYRGAVMHSSEVMGGALAEHILDNPGDYVSVMIDGMYAFETDDGESSESVGWGVLHKLDSAA